VPELIYQSVSRTGFAGEPAAMVGEVARLELTPSRRRQLATEKIRHLGYSALTLAGRCRRCRADRRYHVLACGCGTGCKSKWPQLIRTDGTVAFVRLNDPEPREIVVGHGQRVDGTRMWGIVPRRSSSSSAERLTSLGSQDGDAQHSYPRQSCLSPETPSP
jgi:hypothetical protein